MLEMRRLRTCHLFNLDHALDHVWAAPTEPITWSYHVLQQHITTCQCGFLTKQNLGEHQIRDSILKARHTRNRAKAALLWWLRAPII